MRLLNFWQWSSSYLLSNALRGVLAGYLVASALDVADGVRVEWDADDLIARSGIKVEVKSSAFRGGYARVVFQEHPGILAAWQTSVPP